MEANYACCVGVGSDGGMGGVHSFWEGEWDVLGRVRLGF
jgi:hypothetical protein